RERRRRPAQAWEGPPRRAQTPQRLQAFRRPEGRQKGQAALNNLVSLLPSWEKVACEAGRMRGLYPQAERLMVTTQPASPSSVSLREPPSPPRGEGHP